MRISNKYDKNNEKEKEKEVMECFFWKFNGSIIFIYLFWYYSVCQ